jgi:hypothetical protein
VVDRSRTRDNERVAVVMGFDVHAGASIDGRDRPRVERLCRYLGRPPIAQDRLERLADGKVKYEMKKPWRDGTRFVIFEPDDLMARLCAMVPPPWFHMIRFHGVLAPNATLRKQVVSSARLSAGAASPKPPAAPVGVEQLSLFDPLRRGRDTSAPERSPAVGLVVTPRIRRRCDGVSPMLRPPAMALGGHDARGDRRESGKSWSRRQSAAQSSAAKAQCPAAKAEGAPRAAHAGLLDLKRASRNTPPISPVVRAWVHLRVVSSCSQRPPRPAPARAAVRSGVHDRHPTPSRAATWRPQMRKCGFIWPRR